jgi:hypothetical protein
VSEYVKSAVSSLLGKELWRQRGNEANVLRRYDLTPTVRPGRDRLGYYGWTKVDQAIQLRLNSDGYRGVSILEFKMMLGAVTSIAGGYRAEVFESRDDLARYRVQASGGSCSGDRAEADYWAAKKVRCYIIACLGPVCGRPRQVAEAFPWPPPYVQAC